MALKELPGILDQMSTEPPPKIASSAIVGCVIIQTASKSRVYSVAVLASLHNFGTANSATERIVDGSRPPPFPST